MIQQNYANPGDMWMVRKDDAWYLVKVIDGNQTQIIMNDFGLIRAFDYSICTWINRGWQAEKVS